jgi:protein-tyrosine phosphatase
MSTSETIGVLFVCMGNICRSPMAEALFRHHAEAEGVLHRFHVDSAGTGGWHAGEPPDDRMSRVAASRDVPLSGSARQLIVSDLDLFDHVICMDAENLRGAEQLGRGSASVALLLSYHENVDERDVPDPYYGGPEGFDHVFDLLDVSCRNLVQALLRHDDAAS